METSRIAAIKRTGSLLKSEVVLLEFSVVAAVFKFPLNQKTNLVMKTVKPAKEQTGVSGKNFDETHELTKDIPTHNQLGEEDQEPSWKENLDTPPFLLTLEILNYNVHNCLMDSGAAVNVMPLEICKNINGQLESTPREVTQLDRTCVKVVGELKNVLIRLAENNKIC